MAENCLPRKYIQVPSSRIKKKLDILTLYDGNRVMRKRNAAPQRLLSNVYKAEAGELRLKRVHRNLVV